MSVSQSQISIYRVWPGQQGEVSEDGEADLEPGLGGEAGEQQRDLVGDVHPGVDGEAGEGAEDEGEQRLARMTAVTACMTA